MIPMNEEEKKWRRRDDARVLSQAEEIKADKDRLEQAKIGAREILEEQRDRLKGLAKVANSKEDKKLVEKSAENKKPNTIKRDNGGMFSNVGIGRHTPNPATIKKL